jgi:uncharacterized alkaline shock family protein YloU
MASGRFRGEAFASQKQRPGLVASECFAPKEGETLSKEMAEALGTVRIAPGVLATIAGLTALSVPGVARMSGDVVSGVSKLLGRPDALSGVKIQVKDDAVWVELHLVAEPETNLYQLSTQVQREVAQAIDKMVGMPVRQVDVYIEDVE